jgi:hypothetical protein
MFGRVAEWLKASVLRTEVPLKSGTGGSNPSSTAKFLQPCMIRRVLMDLDENPIPRVYTDFDLAEELYETSQPEVR